jgi:hypothetical protein
VLPETQCFPDERIGCRAPTEKVRPLTNRLMADAVLGRQSLSRPVRVVARYRLQRGTDTSDSDFTYFFAEQPYKTLAPVR